MSLVCKDKMHTFRNTGVMREQAKVGYVIHGSDFESEKASVKSQYSLFNRSTWAVRSIDSHAISRKPGRQLTPSFPMRALGLGVHFIFSELGDGCFLSVGQ